MTDLIFETLITEALSRVTKMKRNGVSLSEAIDQVSNDMELSPPETQELMMRTKKTPSAKSPVVEDDVDDSEMDDGDNHPFPNSIEFGNDIEMEQALAILMYKGVPWEEKAGNRLSFLGPEMVNKAHDALKRRWDFINLEERVVAQVTFDNLQDYNKVLDFMASKNMTVLKDDKDDLDQDLDIEIQETMVAHKKAKKDAKELGQIAPAEPANDMSYKALHRDNRLDPKDLDPFSDKSSRVVRVVKRWR